MSGDTVILHVAGIDKFIPPFIKLVREEFEEEDHRFWLTGSLDNYPIECKDDVYICGNRFFAKVKGFMKLVRQLHASHKVILHGLFNIRVVLILAICPWLLPKCYWVMWGGDLYQYKNTTTAWRSRIKEALRRFVIRRIGHLVTYIEGDVTLAREWYGAKGVYHECLMYLSNVVDPALIAEPLEKPTSGPLNILVGNSADPSNNHLEALERLLPYKDNDIKIFVPLSYGDQDHAKKVIEQGKAWFGNKLVPMTDFMPFDKYIDFLKNIDIAVFNHRRQQAMGNTISLLGMGKKVFMRKDVTQWKLLESIGVVLYDIDFLDIECSDLEEGLENSRIVNEYFTKANLTDQLSGVLK